MRGNLKRNSFVSSGTRLLWEGCRVSKSQQTSFRVTNRLIHALHDRAFGSKRAA